MTHLQFRATLARLKIKQLDCAKLLAVDESTVSRWARGLQPIPRAVSLLLTAWERHPELLAYVK